MPSRRIFPVGQCNRDSNMRSSGHGVSLRPSRGSAYPSSATNSGTDPDPDTRYGWNKYDMPGGRKLYCRLVFAFAAVSLLGAMFVTLAAVFFRASHRMAMEEGMSLPLVWCIIGIVSGSLMIIGSIVLGKLIVSDKWRKNQQPNYPSLAPPRAHFTVRSRSSSETGEVQLELPAPPPYEENPPDNPPAVYTISGPPGPNRVSMMPSQPPPEYTPRRLEIQPPTVDTTQPPTTDTAQTFPIATLPQYEDVAGDPPGLDSEDSTGISNGDDIQSQSLERNGPQLEEYTVTQTREST